MNELKSLLLDVSDSYYDFVVAMLQFAKKKPERRVQLTNYITTHPLADTSDILEYVSTELDLMEDHVPDTDIELTAV